MRAGSLLFPASLVLLAAAAVVAFTSGGLASSGRLPTSDDTGPTGTVGTHHLVLNAMDMQSASPGCVIDHGVTLIDNLANCLLWVAPIHLPDNATMTSMRVFYDDQAEFANFFAAVVERSLDGVSMNNTALAGQLPDPGHAGTDFASIVADAPVDNFNNHYSLEFEIPTSGLAFRSAVITYTVPGGSGGTNVNGDVDCSGAVNPVDSLKILRHDASLSVDQNDPCPEIGT